jgi:ABC-type taurine transport system substrate-binding protein
MSNSWNSVFSPEDLRRVWESEKHPTIANMILNTDTDGTPNHNVTPEGYQRISDQLNDLANLMGARDNEMTKGLAYAAWFMLATLVQQITESREMLASEEGKNAPGVIRRSLINATADQERQYARYVRLFAQLPEGMRPDMRDRRVILPEANQ